MKRTTKNKILAGALSFLLLTPGLTRAQEINPNKNRSTEISLLEKKTLKSERDFSEPLININVSYEKRNDFAEQGIDVSSSRIHSSYPKYGDIHIFNRAPDISLAEEEQIEDMFWDTKYGIIDSYQELIENTKDFSEAQKLVLLAAIGYSMGRFGYEISDNKVLSQEEFFQSFQDCSKIGVCRHIHSNLEQLANDLGIKAAAVTGISGGINHVYAILKIKNGAAIIDYNHILLSSTKNIEKLLDAYQKDAGSVAFQHLFFEDTLLKNKLITKDGKNFLDFTEYDGSSEPLRKSLISDLKIEPLLSVDVNHNDFLTSFKVGAMGLYLKSGQIQGDESSILDKSSLFQLGYKRQFSILDDTVNIIPDLSLVFGSLVQDMWFDEVLGTNADLIIKIKGKKGLNLSSRIAGSILSTLDPISYSSMATLFYDSNMGAGVSYIIPAKNINIEPYVVAQSTFFPKDIGTYKFAPRLSELTAGSVFDMQFPGDASLLLEPYYTKRIWEQEFGGRIGFESRHFGVDAKAYKTDSNYEFCPDKSGFDVNANLKLGRFTLGAGYKQEQTNYDGEIEKNKSLKIQGGFKY